MTLNLGLHRDFTWRFLIADVSKAILGADFLAPYDLLPDLKNARLLDNTTLLTLKGEIAECDGLGIQTIAGTSPFHSLLAEYSAITKRKGLTGEVKHNVVHHIITASEPPVAQNPRCLSPEKLVAAKKEFNAMISLGTARPGDGPWASLLNIVPKTGDEWRPCGYYRALNARTQPDQYLVPHIQDFAQTLHGKPRTMVTVTNPSSSLEADPPVHPATGSPTVRRTKSGRRLRFPDRFQAGSS